MTGRGFAPKRSWGLLLPSFGYARCWRCRRPWWRAALRSVEYAPGRGQFALCRRCWARSSEDIRMAAHLHVCLSGDWSDDERHAVAAAVKRDSRV